MFNRIILIGRLTRDPELRYTSSGIPVAGFSVAVDRPFVDKQGNRGTDFFDVSAWRKLGETCARHLGKGRLVCVEGRLELRSYEDNQGIKRKAVEVIADGVRFLDGPRGQGAAQGQDDQDKLSEGPPYRNEIDFSDDDEPLPF